MPLKAYTVVIDGFETSLLLSEEDAKRLGLAQVKKAPAPANKARRAAANKG